MTQQPPPQPPERKIPDDFVHRAVALSSEKRFSEAIKICRLGLLADPLRLDGRLVLSRALMAQSKYDDVLAEMGVTLEQAPDNTRALLLKAEALVRKQRYGKAREVLARVVDLDPFNHQASLLQDLLDDELERSDGSLEQVPADTRQYPSSKAHEIEATEETGAFLELSTAEALEELSTHDGTSGVVEGAGYGPEDLVGPGAEDDLEDWEREENTVMERAPSFGESDDTPVEEPPGWSTQFGAEDQALLAMPTREATVVEAEIAARAGIDLRGGEEEGIATREGPVIQEGIVTGAGIPLDQGIITSEGMVSMEPLQALPTLEDSAVLAVWEEGAENTVTDGGDQLSWEGGGAVEGMEPTVTEGQLSSWDGGGEVEGTEGTVTDSEDKPGK